MMKKILHHYIIVRNDLPVGTKCAMIVHAAGESCCNFGTLPKETCAVVLSVENEEQLYNIEEQLKKNNIDFKSIFEPDEPYNGQFMAIGISPIVRSENKDFRRIVSRLKLLR